MARCDVDWEHSAGVALGAAPRIFGRASKGPHLRYGSKEAGNEDARVTRSDDRPSISKLCADVNGGVIGPQDVGYDEARSGDHRSQICTALTTLGLEPPLIDVWAFGIQTGRVVEVAPTSSPG